MKRIIYGAISLVPALVAIYLSVEAFTHAEQNPSNLILSALVLTMVSLLLTFTFLNKNRAKRADASLSSPAP